MKPKSKVLCLYVLPLLFPIIYRNVGLLDSEWLIMSIYACLIFVYHFRWSRIVSKKEVAHPAMIIVAFMFLWLITVMTTNLYLYAFCIYWVLFELIALRLGDLGYGNRELIKSKKIRKMTNERR